MSTFKTKEDMFASSDDEDDCHPNIDIKLWKRLQKEKRERERTEQDDRIEALRARIDAVSVFVFFFCVLKNSSHKTNTCTGTGIFP